MNEEEKIETPEADADVETEETVEEVEISEEAQEQIVEKVAKAIVPAVETVVSKSFGKSKEIKSTTVSKEMTFVKYLRALRDNDVVEMKALNETTGSDGGYLVPPSDFIAEVQRLMPAYGSALPFVTIRRTNSNGVTVNKRTTGITVQEVGELSQKPELEPVFGQVEIVLRKFAGIVPLSDELEEDAAVDIFNELAKEFAEAFAKQADELVFNDATYGLLKIAGTVATTAAATFAGVTFDNLNDAIYSIPSSQLSNAKFYMHRTVLGALAKGASTSGGYYFPPSAGKPATIWGYEVVLSDALPALSATALNTAFIVFGDLKNVVLAMKNDMQLTVLTEGTVGSLNLAEKDAKALRGVKRMAAKPVFTEAFAVIKTAASS